MPVIRVVIGARQEFVGAGCCDDIGGAVTPFLRALGIERDQEVQYLARIGVDDGEQCRVGDVAVALIERDLREIDRMFLR